jgi:hypothetical protein
MKVGMLFKASQEWSSVQNKWCYIVNDFEKIYMTSWHAQEIIKTIGSWAFKKKQKLSIFFEISNMGYMT